MVRYFIVKDKSPPPLKYMCLVIKSKEKQTILMECHNNSGTGNSSSVEGTSNRAIPSFYWPTMIQDINEWVKEHWEGTLQPVFRVPKATPLYILLNFNQTGKRKLQDNQSMLIRAMVITATDCLPGHNVHLHVMCRHVPVTGFTVYHGVKTSRFQNHSNFPSYLCTVFAIFHVPKCSRSGLVRQRSPFPFVAVSVSDAILLNSQQTQKQTLQTQGVLFFNLLSS
ncbi:uncharacterized protein LOC130928092 isoform X1 [Corythoichthys intestinalis]|uniref:uncharacterized protein LOC130928092 isoform X1 n=1 Tax=Corythoichthys intestinalis TaxID=161448 RepID=UPI0025A66292|nr:uncharacterized protein LOC130928092 isoform X1 [Corythoichthys intestinalis]XP_057710304.1 uncharacterized protein LOC130928092 isoform X1 [Corythoichthys intestinalis]XP_057710305.1 uncharacterized protein LOC130928092 isoform X1 [Corythoichthys intestinalis]